MVSENTFAFFADIDSVVRYTPCAPFAWLERVDGAHGAPYVLSRSAAGYLGRSGFSRELPALMQGVFAAEAAPTGSTQTASACSAPLREHFKQPFGAHSAPNPT